MTPSEFKAWFDGFTEAFTGTPTKAQWARIKARVAEIDGKPVTERVYVDRYWPTYLTNTVYRGLPWGSGGTGVCIGGLGITSTMAGQNTSASNSLTAASFESHSAMNNLGRAEAKALAA